MSIFLLADLNVLAQEGAAVFQKNCAGCHRVGSETRAPLPDALAKMTKEAILASLETGSMKAQGSTLSASERLVVASFLGKGIAPAVTAARKEFCANASAPLADGPSWSGWGVDAANSRFQPAEAAGLRIVDVPRLKLKWAFGFPGDTVFGQPTVAAGRIFVGSGTPSVYALDAQAGCIYWTVRASSMVRTAVSFDPRAGAIFFGDVQANAYSLDARTGAQRWKTKVDEHPFARITGAPKLHAGRLYVPVSSIEEVAAGNPKYPCCTFRGSVVALDADTGKQIWKSYAIPDPPAPHATAANAQQQGPAGAAIWSSPTIDAQRHLIYVGTGNAYAEPHVPYTDAIIAFDLDTGSMKWARQMTPRDGWNFACMNANKAACPEHSGEDVDFGSSPILRPLGGGKSVLIASQKSGVVYGLDPDAGGAQVWQVRVGHGGALGGVEWGPAADDRAVYVPVSDWSPTKPEEGGGLFALRIGDGGKLWQTAAPKPACLGRTGCSAAQMAPATVIPDVVFSGSMDGHLRAYSAKDGTVLWDYDTLHDFETVNGVKGKGGSLDATGPTIAGGMMFFNSGYGALGGMAGNILLAFSAESGSTH